MRGDRKGEEQFSAGSSEGVGLWERVRRELGQGEGAVFGTGSHEELRSVRGWARRVLGGVGAADECLMVVGELVANVVEHGGGGRVALWLGVVPGGVLGLMVQGPRAVISEEVVRWFGGMAVREGRWGMADAAAERGRGLAIVAEVCVRWEMVTGAVGHGVWCWEICEDVVGWRARALEGVRGRNPGVLVWFGERTGRWWGMAGGELWEAGSVDGLERKLGERGGGGRMGG
ncbi:hypothetical protein [Actinocorallia sp. A-T 12471]|uniref:ATP-binding protein n=1 Tax=Actinocorallia sp. A-T 12471 TaxID=3089813 RepID=UPI0029D2B0B7|nr:hypothetical protein [Actinocorallia sp. A-T 12471]MDX6743498.1 hypothetical protein [Actinocorallia sp. A-T 12471]